MSEMIEPLGEVDVAHVLSKGFSLEQIDYFKETAGGADVYLERAYEQDWLTSFHTARRYMYMTRFVTEVSTAPIQSDSFSQGMSRSYRVVFEEGALPYAYRS